MSDSLQLAAQIAAAFVSNPVNVQEMGDFHQTFPQMFRGIADALDDLAGGRPTAGQRKTTLTATAVSAGMGTTLTCLECGMTGLKMLKRHLLTRHNLTPDEYRENYSLAADARMVALNYSNQRSELAKASGLGKRPEKTDWRRNK